MTAQKVVNAVKKKLNPSKEENDSLEAMIERLFGLIAQIIQENNYPAGAILVGSVAKDTWLPGKKDIDIFLTFPIDSTRGELKEFGLEIGRKVVENLKGKYIIEYAEHPYVRGVVESFNIDFVPCYAVESADDLKSSVDRTPFHTKYVLGKIEENSNLKSEIRLLKQFCMGTGLYGSDSKTQGFSGYLCELMIIHYGTFLKALEAAKKWVTNEYIDLKSSEKKKTSFSDPLILIDPVDTNRNVAAALSYENYFMFKYAADQFLKSPKTEFFFPNEVEPLEWTELSKLIDTDTVKYFFLCFEPPNLLPDVLWPQMRSFNRSILKRLEKNDFHLEFNDVWSDEDRLSVLFFVSSQWHLPFKKLHSGPPLSAETKHQEKFREKYRELSPRLEHGRWVVEIEREYKDLSDLFEDIVKRDPETLVSLGCPQKISHSVSGSEILSGKEIRKYYFTNSTLAKYLTTIVTEKKPWEW